MTLFRICILRRLAACLVAVASVASAAFAQPAPHGKILWDTYGTPHVFARNTTGLFYGFGYAQLQAHGNLILRLYAEARGREAEFYGPAYAAADRYTAANGVWQRGQQWYAQQTPEMKSNLQAFAAGMNAYAQEHPEALAPEARAVLPVSAEDVVAHWERVMEFQYLAPISRVYPVNAATEAMLNEPPIPESQPQDEAGSNGWALAPSKSASGHAMLVMNPHLNWAPSWQTYFEAELSAPGIQMYGATQVGFPVLRFCFSPDHGITNTVNAISGTTVYKLTLAPGGYLYDGKVLPFTASSATIRIKQPDGSLTTETVPLRESIHGPVFTRPDGTVVALRVAGLDRPFGIQEYWDIDRAQGLPAVIDALKRLQVPSFNILYAGRDGHILYQFNGVLPVRTHGDYAFWSGLVPGDTSENLWTRIHPYEDLPRVLDPPAGFVANSNNPPWICSSLLATALPPLDPAEYPTYIATNSLTLRAEQSIALLESRPRFTFDQLIEAKQSTHVLLADRVLDPLLATAKTSDKPLVQQAAAVLAKWNRADDNQSPGALLFETWAGLFAGTQFLGQKNYAQPWSFSNPLQTPTGLADPTAAVAMLEAAARETIARYGTLDRPFGDVSRFRLGTVDLPGNGGFGNTGVFRVITWSPLQADGTRTPVHGETFIAAVEFSTPPRAMGLLTYGESTQPGSKHSGDQLSLLSEKKLRPIWLTPAELQQHIEQTKNF